MLTGISCDAFQLACHVNNGADFFIGIVNFLQFWLGFKRFGERHTGIRRHQLRNTIHKAIRLSQHPPHIADHRFCRHGTERNNLRHRTTSIHFGDVFNHAVAPIHTEVHVKVRHGNPFRIEETLKKQIEFQRIQIGNF